MALHMKQNSISIPFFASLKFSSSWLTTNRYSPFKSNTTAKNNQTKQINNFLLTVFIFFLPIHQKIVWWQKSQPGKRSFSLFLQNVAFLQVVAVVPRTFKLYNVSLSINNNPILLQYVLLSVYIHNQFLQAFPWGIKKESFTTNFHDIN